MSIRKKQQANKAAIILPLILLAHSTMLVFIHPLTSWASPACERALSTPLTASETMPSVEHPLLADLEIRFLRVEEGLKITSPQTQRQAHKLMQKIEVLVNDFIKRGDLSDKDMEKLVQYNAELSVFEKRFNEMIDIDMIGPTDLRRYMFTEEHLHPAITYHAELPELGPVRITFSKEVAELFNQTGEPPRKVIFPLIFRGLVGKAQQQGIKLFSGGKTGIQKEYNGILYRLMEIKKLGTENRILIISSANGDLHFYRHINNHNRIDFIAKDDHLQNYFNNQ